MWFGPESGGMTLEEIARMNDAPQMPPPSNVVTLTLDRNEWNIVLAGLGELPLKIAWNLFQKVLIRVQPPGMPFPGPQAALRGNGGSEATDRPEA